MNRLPKIFALLLLMLTIGLPVNAADKKKIVSLEQASELVRQQSEGKVLSARTTNFNGNRTHRIQVLTPSGRVKIFQIPLNKDRFKSQQANKSRYSLNRANMSNNPSSRSNLSNYRAPNSNTTSVNKPTNSLKSTGDKKQK